MTRESRMTAYRGKTGIPKAVGFMKAPRFVGGRAGIQSCYCPGVRVTNHFDYLCWIIAEIVNLAKPHRGSSGHTLSPPARVPIDLFMSLLMLISDIRIQKLQKRSLTCFK